MRGGLGLAGFGARLTWWTASAARIEADVQAAVRGAYGAPLSLEDIL